MATTRVERRLAAILAADVVGYSRLMGEDEAGTLARLRAVRKELIEPLLAEHRGRIVKLMGDGILCEFPSMVDAVACRFIAEHNQGPRPFVWTADPDRIIEKVVRARRGAVAVSAGTG
jgi:class 3 adenylate cyclase